MGDDMSRVPKTPWGSSSQMLNLVAYSQSPTAHCRLSVVVHTGGRGAHTTGGNDCTRPAIYKRRGIVRVVTVVRVVAWCG